MVVLTTRVSEVTLLRQSRAPVHQWWPLLTLVKSSDPKPPYWSDCHSRIKELGESNVPQTLVYEEGTSLPIGVMQALQEYPNVTLIFRCSYNDTEYEFTIRGDEAKIVIKTAALTK